MTNLVALNKDMIAYTKDTNLFHKGNYHCTADLLFDSFRLDQTSKSVLDSTYAKQLNPNKYYRRLAMQCYFPLYSILWPI